MRRLVFLLVLLLLPGLAPALAQPAAVAQGRILCSPRVPPDEDWRVGSGFMVMRSVAEHLNGSAPALRLENVQQTAKAVPTLEFTLVRPETIPASEWRSAWLEAVAYPADRTPGSIEEHDLIRGSVLPPTPEDDRTHITALFPTIERGGWLPTNWQVVVFVCVDPNYDPASRRVNGKEIRAYARQPFFLSTLRLSTLIGVLSVAAIYLGLAVATMQLQSRQIAHAQSIGAVGRGRGAAFWYAMRPTVIAQDSFGVCSLSRFQVLLFTVVVSGVYAYVMARTGKLPEVSNTVLTLLGITLTGSTLARVAEGSSIDTSNRLWLLGTGIVDPSPRLPRWLDLVSSDGEIDVTRVQALVFSLFAAGALVVNGTGDLANFSIPEQINYLIGISQAVYVAGRALPHDSARRLNEEVRMLQTAEARVLADPANAEARQEFETARKGIGPTLTDVFGERFRAPRLRQFRPGDRVAEAATA
ncbi:hypothetical protein [Roseomonas sp. AR75]|uniref:hypothetical protein n=1 Tax=Roseomonas sp. AR75 TaxID=2562311 RepID=UPI0010BF7397|nr:hypothetical protein [Roseomonas sp. AR75]